MHLPWMSVAIVSSVCLPKLNSTYFPREEGRFRRLPVHRAHSQMQINSPCRACPAGRSRQSPQRAAACVHSPPPKVQDTWFLLSLMRRMFRRFWAKRSHLSGTFHHMVGGRSLGAVSASSAHSRAYFRNSSNVPTTPMIGHAEIRIEHNGSALLHGGHLSNQSCSPLESNVVP